MLRERSQTKEECALCDSIYIKLWKIINFSMVTEMRSVFAWGQGWGYGGAAERDKVA